MSKRKVESAAEFTEKQANVSAVEREAKLQSELRYEREQKRELLKTLSDVRTELQLAEHVNSTVLVPPKWTLKPSGKGKLHLGIPILMLSDCHWDEVVNPNEVEGANKYNRKIAEQRLQRILRNTRMVLREYFAGLKYEGLVLMLGGDMLSGSIHEELEQTNEDTVYGSVDHWSEQLAAFISALAGEFEKLHIGAVVGNHPRHTRKPRSKLRVRDNLDWLLYRMVSKTATGDVSWQIPESADLNMRVYDTAYLLSHGDQFRGGSGIAGMLSPLLLGHHRKSRRQMELHHPYDWMVLGHFHEFWMGKGIIVNGSVKGPDEYAYLNNFPLQRPTQALWITTPENGATFSAPIFADDPVAEGWADERREREAA